MCMLICGKTKRLTGSHAMGITGLATPDLVSPTEEGSISLCKYTQNLSVLLALALYLPCFANTT